jgi:hypothetical protein
MSTPLGEGATGFIVCPQERLIRAPSFFGSTNGRVFRMNNLLNIQREQQNMQYHFLSAN